MRINVYSQEITDEVISIQKTSNTGAIYSAVQMVLHSSPRLHHPPQDDDRSAVTFWLPRSPKRREELAKTFERLAEMVRQATPGTGLDDELPKYRDNSAQEAADRADDLGRR